MDSSKADEQIYWNLYNLATTQLGKTMRKKKFDKLLTKSVDEAMKEIFGETGARIIYYSLEHYHSLKREEIPERLEDFQRELEKILSSGAWVMVSKVLDTLYSNFELEYQNKENHSLANHVGILQKQKKRGSL